MEEAWGKGERVQEVKWGGHVGTIRTGVLKEGRVLLWACVCIMCVCVWRRIAASSGRGIPPPESSAEQG